MRVELKYSYLILRPGESDNDADDSAPQEAESFASSPLIAEINHQ